MQENKFAEFLDKIRDVLTHVSIKTYLYALAAIAIIIVILLNVSSPNKYTKMRKDGKIDIDIDKIASDYGLNLNPTQDYTDYINDDTKNITTDLSKSLYLTNLYLEQNGMSDPTARGKILADIVFNYQDKLIGKDYTDTDLSIVRDEKKESMQNYYDSIKNALDNYKNNFVNNDYKNIKANTQVELLTLKNKIDADTEKNIAITNQVIDDLLAIPATKTGATYQLELINLFKKQIIYFKSVEDLAIDPAKYILVNGDDFLSDFTKKINNINDSFTSYFSEFGVK